LAKHFTTQNEVTPAKTYPVSHKTSHNQDKNIYTSGEQEQLIESSSFNHVLNIAIIAGYLAWSSKRISHLITTHSSTVISIIKQIQVSITGKAK
jgi:hypothetical protein